jgi:membrane protease YdiL (CAAX protease family)
VENTNTARQFYGALKKVFSPKLISSVKNLFIPLLGYLAAVIMASQLFSLLQPEEKSLSDYAMSSTLDLILVVSSYWFIVHRLENRPVRELYFNFKPFIYALLAAALILGLPTLILFFIDAYKVIEELSWAELPYVVAALFLQGIAAEVLFRGILYRNIASWKGQSIAVLAVCTVYASLNLLLDGFHIQVFIGQWLFCCILSLIYIQTGNLWVTGSFHGAWLIISFLPGVLDEHGREGAVILTQVEGEIWITGGQWGAELSIFCHLSSLPRLLTDRISDTWSSANGRIQDS